MSTEGLRKAVLEKARAEAGEILARAKSEADAALASARERAGRGAAEAVENARREAAEARERALSAVEREIRLKLLEEKNRLLAEAFSRAAQAFARLPVEELRDLFAKELEGMELRGATVHVPAGAGREFEPLLKGRAAVRQAHGSAVEEDASLDAGYVVVREDFRLDRSLASRLGDLKSEMRSELARLLFGEEQ